jgi:glycosyltransferase involved in cell wall biosynthesis
LIIATRLPISEEMSAEFPVMHIVDSDPECVVDALKKISSNAQVWDSLKDACEKYSRRYSYENMSGQMVSKYERLLSV